MKKLGIVIMICVFNLVALSAAFGFSWQQYKDAVITVTGQANPETEAIGKLVPEFEKLTGIKVNYVRMPQVQLRDKIIPDLATKSGRYDIVWANWMDIVTYSKDGWILSLDDFIANPDLTDPKTIDLDDFLPLARGAIKYKGQTWFLPVAADSTCLYYRKDLFSESGLDVPYSWKALLSVAKKLTLDTDGDGETDIYGTVVRGQPGTGHMLIYTWAGVFGAYGGQWFDEDWKPMINSDAGIRATNMYFELSKCGPPGVTEYSWYDVVETFSQGRAATTPDALAFNVILGNPEKSKVADKFDVAPWPMGPAGETPVCWVAGFSINAYSKHPEASWLFLQWVTSPQTLKKILELRSIEAPPRKSLFSHPNFVELMGGTENYMTLLPRTLILTDPDLRPRIPEFQYIGRVLSTAIAEALAGGKSVKAALDEANQEIYEIMKRAGYYQ